MTNRPIPNCNIDRVPTVIRYASLAFLVSITLSAASPISQSSDASALPSSMHHRSNAPDPTEVPAGRSNKVSNAKVAARGDLGLSGKWYIFTSPDGDFSLAFPRKPILQDVSEGPLTVIRLFSITLENGMSFSVNFHDIGGDPNASKNNVWDSNLEQLASAADRKEGRRVVQIHRLAKNIVETELWQTVPETGANMNYLRRSILSRGRVYTLACGWVINDKKVDKPTCGKFFNSMRFITKPRRQVQRRF